MTFLKRNWRELTWCIFSATMAGFCIWLAVEQPDHNKALDFWLGGVLYTTFVSLGGCWVWMIFDNADEDARKARYAELDRQWRLLNVPPVELDPVLNAERN